jgi:hypothetical protein
MNQAEPQHNRALPCNSNNKEKTDYNTQREGERRPH